MSATPKSGWKTILPGYKPTPEYLAEIAELEAELEAKVAAQEAAERQAQKDLIKEAIVEALHEFGLLRPGHRLTTMR